jgi:hypothetical protein
MGNFVKILRKNIVISPKIYVISNKQMDCKIHFALISVVSGGHHYVDVASTAILKR